MQRHAPLCSAFVLALLVGRVVDLTTGQPLVSVHVAVQGAVKGSAVTDRDGRFRVGSLRPGTYRVTFSSNDVAPQHRSVVVRNGTTTLNVKLCSTTLDYSCVNPSMPGGGPGAQPG